MWSCDRHVTVRAICKDCCDDKMAALQAFVFVVGGGNYIEYQNLQDYCRRLQNTRRITYGTSELMNAKQFLTQVGSFLHSPTHSLTHPPTHHPLTHHPLNHSPTHLPTRPHPLAHTHSSTHPLAHSPTHPLTHSLAHPLSLVAGRTGKRWRIGNSSDHS